MSKQESKARIREELDKIYINEILRNTYKSISQLDDVAAEAILMGSCRGCAERTLSYIAHNYGYNPEKPDLDAFMLANEKMEKRIAQGQASITKHGDTITYITESGRCICPLVRYYQIVEAFPNLCLCSKNYLKVLYEAAAKRPVKVEVVESYIRGGDRCHFLIELL